MFTIEMDKDFGEDITITTLDDRGEAADVEVILMEDAVYIRQFDSDDEECQLIVMSVNQLKDIVAAMNLPQGAYYQNSSLKGN